jgi:hypothetical protein
MVSSASVANALSFNWTFSATNVPGATVSGTVSGLVEGNNTGGAPIVVTVTDYTGVSGGEGLGTYNFVTTSVSAGSGGTAFTVTGGSVTYADWYGAFGDFDLYLGTNFFATFPAQLTDLSDSNPDYIDSTSGGTNSLTFTPVPDADPVPFEFNPGLGILLTFGIIGAQKLWKKKTTNISFKQDDSESLDG